jgi:hypothetical protein
MGIAGQPVQVRNHDGAGVDRSEGPFLRSDLPIAGFAVIEASTLEEAVSLVSKTPCAVAHGVVEVWPHEVDAVGFRARQPERATFRPSAKAPPKPLCSRVISSALAPPMLALAWDNFRARRVRSGTRLLAKPNARARPGSERKQHDRQRSVSRPAPD